MQNAAVGHAVANVMTQDAGSPEPVVNRPPSLELFGATAGDFPQDETVGANVP